MNIFIGIRQILQQSEDELLVLCKVEGTVCVGDELCIINCGEDEVDFPVISVLGIESSPGESVQGASDGIVILRIEYGLDLSVRPGTVLTSQECTADDMPRVRKVYTQTLGDVYVAKRGLEIPHGELAELSLADCAEIWRLFMWFQSNVAKKDGETSLRENRDKLENLGKAMSEKLLGADSVYCVYNRITDEPHMISRTMRKDDSGYFCSPPHILLLADGYQAQAAISAFSEEKYEIKLIENGEDGKGIESFLRDAFWLNGACAAAVSTGQTLISAEKLVPKPSFEGVPAQNIPLTNSDLMRWMLLMAQMGKPETEDAKVIYSLYYRFFSKELQTAKLLAAMNGEFGVPKDGYVVAQKGATINLAVMQGKKDRPALRMYTDWKRLRAAHGTDYLNIIQVWH